MGGVNGVTGLHKDDGIVTAVLEAAVVAACGKEVAGRGKTRQRIPLRGKVVADGETSSRGDSFNGEDKRLVLVAVYCLRVPVHVHGDSVVVELDVFAAIVGDNHALVVSTRVLPSV